MDVFYRDASVSPGFRGAVDSPPSAAWVAGERSSKVNSTKET